VIESHCPTCSSPVLSSQAYCPNCGTQLSRLEVPVTLPSAEPETTAQPQDSAEEQSLGDSSIDDEQPPMTDPAGRIPGGYIPPSPGLEPSAWAMTPSSSNTSSRAAGPSISLQIGARPMSLAGRPAAAEPPLPEPPNAPVSSEDVAREAFVAPEPPPAPTAPEPPPAQTLATQTQPLPPFVVPQPPPPPSPFARPSYPPAPVVPPTPPEPVVEAPSRPAHKESIQELVAFGLVAAGAVIGILSLFLPWSGITGIGIGTESIAGSPPPPNQWGWGMPAGFPLFLLSLPVLVAAAASDRAQERLPKLALVIGRVTDLVLPMVLGGLYIGVVVMYMTVPANYGPGIYTGQYALLLGAGLMIAGAIVTIFFPPEVATDEG
jgi:uncharacterized Zn finger protein (UPF0148 family)